jgi:transcriptional regulator with XRE-family HTH domain
MAPVYREDTLEFQASRALPHPVPKEYKAPTMRPSREVRSSADRRRPWPDSTVRDWDRWMTGMGLYTRRLRELAGLSQERLARLAGVSQGAVSRLEMGRAVHTPLIVVMKVNAAMRTALSALDPAMFSQETKQLMELQVRGVPGNAQEFEAFPIARDPRLTELVRLFWRVPPRNRDKLLSLMHAAVTVLDGDPSPRRGSRRRRRASVES